MISPELSGQMEVRILRSRRRRRTVSARLTKGTLVVRVPASLPEGRLEEIVSEFKRKFERRRLKAELNSKQNLAEIAAALNRRYFFNKLKINSIEYVTDQEAKFGCCNYTEARIRISHRISLMPKWVRDYVIVHEMAHLIEPNHGRAFWEIVARYSLSERARGYLMAVGLESLDLEDGPAGLSPAG
ncbi:MAG: M48 family metallopeptidase [Candidatus Omnitrophica bacterium]|nr:M48 family metallopeptidase [Candidatus Omnitrophota bacterium]